MFSMTPKKPWPSPAKWTTHLLSKVTFYIRYGSWRWLLYIELQGIPKFPNHIWPEHDTENRYNKLKITTNFFLRSLKKNPKQIKIQEKPNEFNTISSLIRSYFSSDTSHWYLNSVTKSINIKNYWCNKISSAAFLNSTNKIHLLLVVFVC